MPAELPLGVEQIASPTSGLKFGLLDLTKLTTWLAALCAIVTPFARDRSHVWQLILMGSIGIQVAMFLASVYYHKSRREKAIAQAGTFLGFAEQRPIRGRNMRILLGMAILSCIMLVQSLVVTNVSYARSFPFINWPTLMLCLMLLSILPWSQGRSYFPLRLAHSKGHIEFFQHGVVVRAYRFVPWRLVDVKWYPSTPDQVTIVVRFPAETPEVWIYDVPVSESLRIWLIQQREQAE